jgi:hypothetical protein
MPLFHGKSRSEESGDAPTHGGSMAVAYSLARRKKKLHGDRCEHGDDAETCPKCTYPEDSSSEVDPGEMERMAKGGETMVHRRSGHGMANEAHGMKRQGGESVAGVSARANKRFGGSTQEALDEHRRVLGEMRSDKGDRRNMAEGGGLEPKEGGAKYGSGKTRRDFEKGVNLPHPGSKRGVSYAGDALRAGDKEGAVEFHRAVRREKRDYGQETAPARNLAEGGMLHAYDEAEYNRQRATYPNEAAMTEDERRLGQHGEIEEGPQGTWMAGGGQITGNYSDQEDGDGQDMVGRIMAQRQRMFSKGGRVANQDEPEADFAPNEFDDLHLRDNLEQHDTAANSGDEMSDEGEDERRSDIVSRIMRSRRKLPGHNPRPA